MERGLPLQPLIISMAPHSSQCVHIVRSPSALGYADKRSFGICVHPELSTRPWSVQNPESKPDKRKQARRCSPVVSVALLLGLHEPIREGAVSRRIGRIAVVVNLAVHRVRGGAGQLEHGRELIVTFHYLIIHAREWIESL